MGVVLAAKQVSLDRQVALKVLLEDDGPMLAECRVRLEREAKLLQKMNHPNIVRLFDVLNVQGQTVLVFEYIAGGRTLEESISSPPDHAARHRLLEQVLRGLAHVHAAGVLHRDLKPSNVLVAEDGTPKIIDLGLARDVSADETRQTQAGSVIGTLAYMAPEQLVGEDVTAAADVYAWGLIAYELYAGKMIFSARASAISAHQRLTRDIVPLRSHETSVDARLARFIERCIARKPADRPADATAALAEWMRLAEPPSADATQGVPARGRRTGRSLSGIAPAPATAPAGTTPAWVWPALGAFVVLGGILGHAIGARGAMARTSLPHSPSVAPREPTVRVQLKPDADTVRVRVETAPAAAARLSWDDRFGSRALTSATSTEHDFAVPAGPLDDSKNVRLSMDGSLEVSLRAPADPLMSQLEQALRSLDPAAVIGRANRLAGQALTHERRQKFRDDEFPPALREAYRRARPFAAAFLGGARSPAHDALRKKVCDLEILESFLDRCGIDTPVPAADLWPEGWASRAIRQEPARSWHWHYMSGATPRWEEVSDVTGKTWRAGVGRDASSRFVHFALGLGASAGDRSQTICTLPLSLPPDRDPAPVRVVLDAIDLPRSAIWIAANGFGAVPISARPGFQFSPKDTQREHSRILPPSLLRRGRNDITIEVRAFPGLSDKTPAYINGVMFAWPE
jgi:hypothetical protein